MDRFDRRILSELQADSGRPLSALAERVGLSLSSCHRRVRRLEADGLIRGYGARLDARALGLGLEALVEISLASQSREALERFEGAVADAEEILECKLTSGGSDYLLRVFARDIGDYERIHRETLARLPGVAGMRSVFTLRTIKPWRGLPLRREGGPRMADAPAR